MNKNILLITTAALVLREISNRFYFDYLTILLTISLSLIIIFKYLLNKPYIFIDKYLIIYLFSAFFSITIGFINEPIFLLGSITSFFYPFSIYIILSSIKLKSNIKVQYLKIIFYLSLIISFFAFIQIFVDFDLFGLTNLHNYYSDVDVMETGVTKRAVSLIGSPQNLGLFLVCFINLPLYFLRGKFIPKITSLFITIGSLLSGSAVVILGIFGNIMIFGLNLGFSKKIAFTILIVFILTILIYSVDFNYFLNKDFLESFYIIDIFSSRIEAYSIDKFIDINNLLAFFIGHGTGSADRLVEVFYQSNNQSIPDNWLPGNESFLLKTIYEQGLIGFTFLSILITSRIYKIINGQYGLSNPYLTPIIVILLSAIFTPTLCGLFMNYIFWTLLFLGSSK